ncbi:MAG: DUF1573 domain-containing protein [Planctomycetota bacterium]
MLRSLLVIGPLVGACAFLASPCAGQEAPAPAPQETVTPAVQVSAEPEVVDFGDVLDGEPTLATVKFTNICDEDVPVRQVRTTCGCTVATVHGPDGAQLTARPPKPEMLVTTLAPGEAISVDVKMDTSHANGQIEKQLQLFITDPVLPTLQVPVRARVTRAFAVSPETLNLGKITKSGKVEQTIVIQAQAVGDWSIEGFESALPAQPLPDWIQFKSLDDEGLHRRVQITIDGPRSVGPFTSKVRVKLAHERVKGADFFLYGMVEPDVAFDTGNPTLPGALSFDQMERGSASARTLTITNRDPATPYLLESVDLQIQPEQKEFFETILHTDEEGMSYTVEVKARADMPEPFFRGNLVLHAQHPDLPQHVVSFHGWVKN